MREETMTSYKFGMLCYYMPVAFGDILQEDILQGNILHKKKISQLALASLQTSHEHVVIAQLVASCQQVWNKPSTTFNNLVDVTRLVTTLFQQVCYNP